MSGAMVGAGPAAVVLVPFEARPVATTTLVDDDEFARLCSWLAGADMLAFYEAVDAVAGNLSWRDDTPLVFPDPSVVIWTELEARPRVFLNASSPATAARLGWWLGTHPEYLDLVTTATELADEAEAA